MLTRYVASSQNFKTNKDPQAKPDEGNLNKDKTNMMDYLDTLIF